MLDGRLKIDIRVVSNKNHVVGKIVLEKWTCLLIREPRVLTFNIFSEKMIQNNILVEYFGGWKRHFFVCLGHVDMLWKTEFYDPLFSILGGCQK